MCGSAGAFDPNATCATETNALSKFPITVDGRFTNIISEGGPSGLEWSDIIPQVFVSDASGALFRTCAGDPNASSYVYTSLDGGVDALYLMYDFVAETSDPSLFADGQTIAQVSFGVHLPAQFGGVAGQNTPITVRFVKSTPVIGASAAAVVIGGGSQVNVVFDVNIPGGQTNQPGFLIGLEGAVSFGSSPNSTANHLQAELGVGLRIPAGFGNPGGPFPGNGIDPATGLYDPAPKFWGSGFNNPTGGGGGGGGGVGLAARAATLAPTAPANHPASANIVTINPDGSVTVNSGADAGPGFVPFDTTDLRSMVLAKFQALLPAATDKHQKHELGEIVALLQASLNPALYADAARLKVAGGIRVFALDAAVLEEILEMIRETPTGPLATALQACVDKLTGLDGDYARVAINDAIAAGGDPKRIKAAKDALAAGDKDAAAGKTFRAIADYASAWSAAVGRGGRGDDRDDDRDRGRH